MRGVAKLGGLSFGATLGGLLVGILEAIYRDAPLGYAALLYGAAWALAGTGLVALLAMLGRPRAIQRSLTTFGLSLSLGLSTFVLGRFIVHRDLFAEAPESRLFALLIGLLLGGAVAFLVQLGGAWVRKRFLADRLPGPSLWALPALVLLAFFVRARAGNEEVATELPGARPLEGRGVVLVVADTLRADALGAYGAKLHRDRPPTPRLDAFAQGGTLFTDVSAQASWTRPAVASIMTSRHPSAHDTMSKMAILPEALPTLASELKQQGVATAAVVTNYNLEAQYGFARGFSRYTYLAPARYLGAPEAASRLAAYNAYRLLRERFFVSARQPDYFYRSGAAVNAAGLTLLDEIGDGDFFLWLHYMEPHDPYFAVDGKSYARVSTPHPPAAWAEDMHAAYKDGVRRFDDAFGQLLDALAARGLRDRTTIIVVADHGEEFAEHGGFYHGTTLYEEQLRVPFIIAGPGVPSGERGELTRQIDVAPTVLARFAVAAPPSFEGRDVLGTTPPPTLAVAEEDHEGNVLKAVREGARKLIVANEGNPRGLRPLELYDLGKDPREQYPLSDGGESTRLSGVLDEALAAAKRGGAVAKTKDLDAQSEAQLRSLGYVQ